MARRLYFDTSAFVKLVIQEEMSEEVEKLFLNTPFLVSSRLLIAEFESVLKRLRRDGILDSEERLSDLRRSGQESLEHFRLYSVDAVLAHSRAVLQGGPPLRTLDAIHLASAQSLMAELVTFDKQLETAARSVGVPLAF